MKRILGVLVLLCAIGAAFASPADAAAKSRQMNAKQKTYNKNYLPAGWKYEVGYTLWRTERKLAANPRTYKKYLNDKAWRNKLHRDNRPEEILLSTLDWTAEEVALFWERYEEYLKFQPSGVTEE